MGQIRPKSKQISHFLQKIPNKMKIAETKFDFIKKGCQVESAPPQKVPKIPNRKPHLPRNFQDLPFCKFGENIGLERIDFLQNRPNIILLLLEK